MADINSMRNVVKGRANTGLSLFLIAFGCTLFYFSTWGNWTLAFHNKVLPPWTMQALGIVALVVGLFLILVKDTLCGFCHTELYRGTARFKPGQEDAVLSQFQQGRFGSILDLPWVGLAADGAWDGAFLDATYLLCPKCAKSGYVELETYDGSSASKAGIWEFTEEEAKAMLPVMERYFPNIHDED